MTLTSPDKQFERIYHATMNTAFYTVVWCLCFYWPQFIAHMTIPDGVMKSEIIALMIVQPIALTALGARTGLKGASVHLFLAIIAIVGSSAFVIATGRHLENDFIRNLMIASMIAAYAIGGYLTYRKQTRA